MGRRCVPASFAYYIVTPDDTEPSTMVSRLIEWLIAESQRPG